MKTLLDTKETTALERPPDTFQALCVKNSPQEWKQARAVYKLLEDTHQLYKLDALDYCRKVSWFVRHEETGKVKIASQHCHLRWCPLCASSRRNYISHQVKDWCEKRSHLKFITLTIKHSDDTITEQIDHLYNSFKKLRKNKEFKKHITGGIWFFQIKMSKTSEQWHPHLHVIGTGKFYSNRRLSALWERITGDSKICNIKSVKDKEKAVQYAARYAAKPAELAKLPIADAAELVVCMHGRRICGSWGIKPPISFRPKKPEDADQWKNIGDYFYVAQLYNDDPSAKAIFDAYRLDEPLDSDCDLSYVTKIIDGRDLNDPPESPPSKSPEQWNLFY